MKLTLKNYKVDDIIYIVYNKKLCKKYWIQNIFVDAIKFTQITLKMYNVDKNNKVILKNNKRLPTYLIFNKSNTEKDFNKDNTYIFLTKEEAQIFMRQK